MSLPSICSLLTWLQQLGLEQVEACSQDSILASHVAGWNSGVQVSSFTSQIHEQEPASKEVGLRDGVSGSQVTA